jgi:heam-based aerotactic trancducer
MALTEDYGLDAAEREKRKRFVRLTDEDVRLLTALLPTIERRVDGLVEAFYARVLALQDAREFFQVPDVLLRVKREQRNYLLDLFKGRYDETYIERRLQIGHVHARIGLPPWLYIGGNSVFFELLTAVIRRRYMFRPYKMAGTLLALQKLLNLDQQLVIDTYIGGMVKQLTDLGNRLHQGLEVLAPAARQASEQTEAALSLSERGTTEADAGNEGARRMLAGLGQQMDKVLATEHKIEELGTQLTLIEHIATKVTAISHETDLLAINASVQASHQSTGHSGFRIVAQEVRKLSDQTRRLIDEIRSLLSEIRSISGETITTARETREAVDAGTSLAETTGRAFSDLAGMMTEIHTHMEHISNAATRQADAIQELQKTAVEP